MGEWSVGVILHSSVDVVPDTRTQARGIPVSDVILRALQPSTLWMGSACEFEYGNGEVADFKSVRVVREAVVWK